MDRRVTVPRDSLPLENSTLTYVGNGVVFHQYVACNFHINVPDGQYTSLRRDRCRKCRSTNAR